MLTVLRRLVAKPIKAFLRQRGYYIIGNRSLHGDPQHFGAIMFSRKLEHFDFFYKKIQGLEGDVVESGIWWGYGLLAHLRYTRMGGHNRKIIGFDSFQGHSQPHEKDLIGGRFGNPGSLFFITEDDAWKTCVMGTEKTLDELKKTITIVPGWMQETMPKFKAQNPMKIALVHCDPDLYEPIFLTLSNVWGKIVPGGIVVIGRMNNPEYMGKTEAVKDFLKTLPTTDYKLESTPIHELETNKYLDLFYITKT
jgi:hypothetical protein